MNHPLAGILSPKQELAIREASGSVNLWEGSIRSGKTYSSLLRWVMYCATSNVRGELVVISRTRASAARNVFATLQDPTQFGDLGQYVQYTPGADQATILGRKMWVLGSSDVRAENTIRGLTGAGAYVDEATLLREDYFTQIVNRQWEGAKVFATTNPDNPAHWLKKKFIDRYHRQELPDWRVWKFGLDDNPALSEARKEKYRRENTGLLYRRNILGEWVAGEGAIYPDMQTVPWEQLPRMHRLLAVGVDYGVNHATTAVLLGVAHDLDEYGRRTGSTLYLVDEWGYDQARHNGVRVTNQALSDQFRAWLYDTEHLPHRQHLVPEHLFVDYGGGGASLITQLQTDGVKGIATPDKDVSYGIGTMASLLTNGRLKVSTRCEGFLEEAPGYSWDPKAAERGEDAPIKLGDDYLDAARYAVVSTESVWRPLLN